MIDLRREGGQSNLQVWANFVMVSTGTVLLYGVLVFRINILLSLNLLKTLQLKIKYLNLVTVGWVLFDTFQPPHTFFFNSDKWPTLMCILTCSMPWISMWRRSSIFWRWRALDRLAGSQPCSRKPISRSTYHKKILTVNTSAQTAFAGAKALHLGGRLISIQKYE